MNVRSSPTAIETQPLRGRRILITRPGEQSDEFVNMIQERGAEALLMPTINIEGPEDWGHVDQAIERLGEYDWLVFTSANAVNSFCQRFTEHKTTAQPNICALGPATAEALTAQGFNVDLMPQRYTAEGVLAVFSDQLEGLKFLFPRGNLARPTLPRGLRQRGAQVDEMVVYRNIPAGPPDPVVIEMLAAGSIDVVTFTSSSTAENFVRLIGGENIEQWKDRFLAASIGPKTSQTIRRLNLPVDIEARTSTAFGLIDAIAAYFRAQRSSLSRHGP